MPEVSNITWEGREIRLSYTREYFDEMDHLEVRSGDDEPLPITSTGYRSEFFQTSDPEPKMHEIERMVIAWLDSEAAKQPWQDYLLTSQQLSLF